MIKHVIVLLHLDGKELAPHKEDIGQILLLVNVAKDLLCRSGLLVMLNMGCWLATKFVAMVDKASLCLL